MKNLTEVLIKIYNIEKRKPLRLNPKADEFTIDQCLKAPDRS